MRRFDLLRAYVYTSYMYVWIYKMVKFWLY